MMRIEYDPGLVEHAVFLAIRADSDLERKLHEILDPCYDIEDEEHRNSAFERTYAAWFGRLELDRLITDLISERPLIAEHVDKCVIREAARKRDEYAELFVQPDASPDGSVSRTLLIQICPESLVQSTRLVPYLRREFLHVADMLDEGFGYVPVIDGGAVATQNLIRDRFRVLWDTYVEGRLIRQGKVTPNHKERLRSQFERAFTVGGSKPQSSLFDRIVGLERVTHGQLLEWARDPVAGLQTAGIVQCSRQAVNRFGNAVPNDADDQNHDEPNSRHTRDAHD